MDLGWISLFCGTRKGHYKASDPFSFSAMNNVLKLPMSNSLLRMPRSLSASTMGRHGMRHPWSASLWDCWNWRWNSARTGFGSCCNVSGFGVKRDIDGHSKLPNASQNRRQQWILKQYSAFRIKALGLKSDSGNPPNCPKLRSRTPWTHRFVSPTRCSLGEGKGLFGFFDLRQLFSKSISESVFLISVLLVWWYDPASFHLPSSSLFSASCKHKCINRNPWEPLSMMKTLTFRSWLSDCGSWKNQWCQATKKLSHQVAVSAFRTGDWLSKISCWCECCW